MIIFLGVSGSGKSLQGKMLADDMGYPWLSTGEFLRMLLSGETRKAMVAGQLLPDDQAINLLDKILGLTDPSQECVLDGFPRTSRQADWLLDQVRSGRFKITKVFSLEASEELVRSRLLTRARVDDHDSAIQERLDEYKQNILPIIQQFKDFGLDVVTVDASNSVTEVHNQIVSSLKV